MINAKDLRIGNYAIYHGDEDMICKLDAQDICNIAEEYMENHVIHSPLPLTEENILKLRRFASEDFKPIEFACYPPGERQVDNQYWSSWMNEDYKLHLSPNYRRVWKDGEVTDEKVLEFWFIWYQDGNQFIPLMNIRDHKLMYVHQLQNIYYDLCGKELIFKDLI